jgi:hypothetical protein
MNNGEVLNGCPRNSDVRNPFRWRRQRREKRKWEMAHSIAKLGTIGPVPGIDGVESFELRDPGSFHHSRQIQTRIGDRACTIGKANQRQHRARRPDFGVSRARSLQRGKRKNNVADRTGPNQEPAVSG